MTIFHMHIYKNTYLNPHAAFVSCVTINIGTVYVIEYHSLVLNAEFIQIWD